MDFRPSLVPPGSKPSLVPWRWVGVLAAFALLVGVAATTDRRLAQHRVDVEWIEHTHRVIETIESTRVALLATDSARRSYRLSLEQADRDAIESRVADTWANVDTIASLVQDNRSQQARVAALRPLIEERIVIVHAGLDLPRWDNLPQSTRDEQRAIQARGLAIAKQIREISEAMLAEEGHLLVSREAQSLASASSAHLAILGGGAIGLALVAVFFVSLDRENRRRMVAQSELQKSNALVSAVIEGTTDHVSVKDLDGRYLLVNLPTARYLRRGSAAEVVGKPIAEFMSSEAVAEVLAADRRIIARGEVEVVEQDLVNFGEKITFLSTKAPYRDAEGHVHGVITVARDISQRKALERELARQNAERGDHIARLERQSVEMRALSEMGNLLSTAGGDEEAFGLVGHYAKKLFDLSGGISVIAPSRDSVDTRSTWGGGSLTASFTPSQCWALRTGRPHASGVGGSLVCEHLGDREEPAWCVPLVAHGETRGVLHLLGALHSEDATAFLAAFTEQVSLTLANVQLRDKLRAEAVRDPLTGLYNRRYLNEMLEREVSRAKRRDTPISVIMVDLDHFKRLNDTFGHAAGDAVLKQFGQILLSSVRREDIACRYGGEEFAVILPELPLDKARERAETWRAAIVSMVVDVGGTQLGSLSASFGVAVFPQNGLRPEDLMRAADTALYRAKREGRDRVVTANEERRSGQLRGIGGGGS